MSSELFRLRRILRHLNQLAVMLSTRRQMLEDSKNLSMIERAGTEFEMDMDFYWITVQRAAVLDEMRKETFPL